MGAACYAGTLQPTPCMCVYPQRASMNNSCLALSSQILGWLLRAHQTEVKRPLVREALDLLLPVLHEGRFTPSSDGGAGSPASTPSAAGPGAGGSLEPHWVRVIRKALTEEQGSYTQQMHVWQVILRNADILYPHRAHFVPSMVPIIARYVLGTGSTSGLWSRMQVVRCVHVDCKGTAAHNSS
jgi:hypothetical protein